MGWSMFLEALFATVGTAIATGGYIYFLMDLLVEGVDKSITATAAGLVTVVLFAAIQWVGVREQAKIMEWLTYGAIVGLVWFWIACVPGIELSRIFTGPELWTPNWWGGVVKAIPFAIWWLVMIETVALSPEEAHEPHRTIPRGLTLAQITLIVLVVLTWFVAVTAGSDYRKTGDEANSFPLPGIYREVWPDKSHLPHVVAFSVVALFGLVVSYNGMIYAVSRQSFSLGRAGYLPRVLGHVHPDRRTPDASIIFWSLVVAGFVVWSYFNADAVTVAVLTCNLTALIWYVLAMICLFVLRVKEPNMPRPYKVPLYPFLPALVIAMSVLAAAVYGWLSRPEVLWLTVAMYAGGLAYYILYARTRRATAAPEELAARAASELI
jgi:ethanolamine permease